MNTEKPRRRRNDSKVDEQNNGRHRIVSESSGPTSRACSPDSLMMALSTVHGAFISNSIASSPESSPRSTSSRSSYTGRPPVVSVSPTNFSDNHHQLEIAQTPRHVRTTVADIKPKPSSSVNYFSSSQQQAHHPSYSFRRVRSLPAETASISTNRVSHAPDSSAARSNGAASLAGVGSTCTEEISQMASSVMRLVQAVQNNEARPSGLTLEEKALWDAIQVSKRQARQEGLNQAADAIMKSSHAADDCWEVKFVQIQEKAIMQQRDNSRSLQAIQCILADVQAQRDEAVHQLLGMQCQSNASATDSCTTASSSDPEREHLQRDLRSMSARIVSLEKELRQSISPPLSVLGPMMPFENSHNDDDDDNDDQDEDVEPCTGVDDPVLPSFEVDQLELEKKQLQEELEWKNNQIESLRLEIAESNDSARLDELQRELKEKSGALENAKMIIGSLESASGSLATDLRAKLKWRDDEILMLQKQTTESKQMVEKLSKELSKLRELPPQVISKFDTEAEQVKRLQLSSRLETNMTEIFAASVVLESTQDPSAVAKLSELLTDCCNTLKEGIDVIENGHSDEDECVPARLWKELMEKRKTVQNLEENITRQQREFERFRIKTAEAERKSDGEIHSLRAEIKILQQQCNTNMEVLTRKERELTVLRDSLMVSDDAVGYISDDDDDDDDDETGNNGKQQQIVPAPPTSFIPTEYGPSQAEALARLRAHGGNLSFDSGTYEKERMSLETVQMELIKTRADYDKAKREHKLMKESLSNAKMIISSLERANKSMMEDLRARLQDSNSAIASLLEKSLESERTCVTLRAELEVLKMSQSPPKADEDETTLALVLTPPPHSFFPTETID